MSTGFCRLNIILFNHFHIHFFILFINYWDLFSHYVYASWECTIQEIGLLFWANTKHLTFSTLWVNARWNRTSFLILTHGNVRLCILISLLREKYAVLKSICIWMPWGDQVITFKRHLIWYLTCIYE